LRRKPKGPSLSQALCGKRVLNPKRSYVISLLEPPSRTASGYVEDRGPSVECVYFRKHRKWHQITAGGKGAVCLQPLCRVAHSIAERERERVKALTDVVQTPLSSWETALRPQHGLQHTPHNHPAADVT